MAEKIMNSYETIFIIDAALEEDAVNALKEKFTNLIAKNGTVETVDEWGKRRLAYEVQHMKEAFYYFIQFDAAPTAPAEIENRVRIMENVVRFLCVRQDEA